MNPGQTPEQPAQPQAPTGPAMPQNPYARKGAFQRNKSGTPTATTDIAQEIMAAAQAQPAPPAKKSWLKWLIIGVVLIVAIVAGVSIFTSIRNANSISSEDVYQAFSSNLSSIEELEDLYDSLTGDTVYLRWAFSDENKAIVDNGIAPLHDVNDVIKDKGAALLPSNVRDSYNQVKNLLADRISKYEKAAQLYNAIFALATERQEDAFLELYNDSSYANVQESLDAIYKIYSYPIGSEKEDIYMDLNKGDVAGVFRYVLDDVFSSDTTYIYVQMDSVINTLTGEQEWNY